MRAFATSYNARTDHSAWMTPLRDALPIILTLTPVGLALGQAIASANISAVSGWLTAPLLYGASAQLAAVTSISAGATASSVLMSVAIVNSRTLFYSAGLRPLFQGQPRWFRLVAPYFLVDPLFALVTSEQRTFRTPAQLRTYYLVAGAAIWVTWLPLVAAGMVLGPFLPFRPALRFALPALLIGMLAPALRSHSRLLAAGVSAGTVAIIGPLRGFSLLVGVAAGASCGAILTRRRS
jgi:predicted branched-subunit amino acid permease